MNLHLHMFNGKLLVLISGGDPPTITEWNLELK